MPSDSSTTMTSEALAEVPLKQMWRFTEGGSDKDYLTMLNPVEGGLWLAQYSNGKHGGTLTTPRTKMAAPAPYVEARAAYDALCRERIKGRYLLQDDAGGGYVGPAPGATRQSSGLLLQLLASITDEQAAPLLTDDRYIAQEKANGKRMAIIKGTDGVKAGNREGLFCGMPQEVADAAASIAGDFIIDGEALGSHLRAFDILERNGRDLRGLPVERRLEELAELLAGQPQDGAIRLTTTAWSTAEKVALDARVRAADGEGIVYKRRGSSYVGGEPGRDWHQVKHKFYATVSCVVAAVNKKRSMQLELLDGDTRVKVGNCTIMANQEFPEAGQVVEVRYLYAHRGGALVQPTYLGPRDDVAVSECTLGQLKYRGEDSQ